MIDFFFKMLDFGLWAARWCLMAVILLSLFGMLIPYVSNIESYQYLQYLIQWENILNQSIKNTVPTEIADWDLSRLIPIIVSIILIEITKSVSAKLNFIEQKYKMLRELKRMQLRYKYKSPEEKNKIAKLKNRIQKVHLESGKSRQDLLRDFANIKKELEKVGRNLTFLAIDVVDSTNMKKGEAPETVELDFHEYHDFVEAKFRKHGIIKASWTPDGVMACFNTTEDAVQAAQDILNELEYFNQHVKNMKKDFKIRCGINTGRVYYDESIPLEQFSDRVIDIAGHMQKHASPNSIQIARQIIEPITNYDDFTPAKRIVDGLEVSSWQTSVEKTKNNKQDQSTER